jgi:hypothetical protein
LSGLQFVARAFLFFVIWPYLRVPVQTTGTNKSLPQGEMGMTKLNLLLLALTGFAFVGCATVSRDNVADSDEKEELTYVTGSNIPRKGPKPAAMTDEEKQRTLDALRQGSNTMRDSGKGS